MNYGFGHRYLERIPTVDSHTVLHFDILRFLVRHSIFAYLSAYGDKPRPTMPDNDLRRGGLHARPHSSA